MVPTDWTDFKRNEDYTLYFNFYTRNLLVPWRIIDSWENGIEDLVKYMDTTIVTKQKEGLSRQWIL